MILRQDGKLNRQNCHPLSRLSFVCAELSILEPIAARRDYNIAEYESPEYRLIKGDRKTQRATKTLWVFDLLRFRQF
jgi:hypothetical protein